MVHAEASSRKVSPSPGLLRDNLSPSSQGNDLADLADKHDHDSNTEPRRQKMIQTAVSVRTVVSKKS